MIILIEEEHADKNLNDIKILTDLLNTEFGTDLTETQIRNYYSYEEFESLEAEDEFLIRKHCCL